MINLRFLFLVTLISFSVHDDHCFGKFQICPSHRNTLTGSIDHCFEYKYDDKDDSRIVCSSCNFGYAVSNDRMSCIAHKNCGVLDEGNKICKYCYPGYYLSGNECKKMKISHCEYGVEENKCLQCADYAILNGDWQCIIPTTTIEGCREYLPDGSCSDCAYGYELIDNVCHFSGCGNGETPIEYCGNCEVGYLTDNKDGKCKAYSEFKDSFGGNKIKAANALLLIILAFLI